MDQSIKRTVESLQKELKIWLILAIFWGLVLALLAGFGLQRHPWSTWCIVLFVGSLLRHSVVALAIGIKKEIQELKDKITKVE